MSTDSSRSQILVTVGEGVGNMVETTPLIHALSRYGDVWVWAKPQSPGTEVILANLAYVRGVIRLGSAWVKSVGDVDLAVQTYSANTQKDGRFGQFENVVEFTEEDSVWARIHGEAAGNLRQLRKVPWIKGWEDPERFPRSFVNCRESDGIYDVVLGSGAYDESKVWPGFYGLKLELRRKGLSFRDLSEGKQLLLQDVAATIRDAGVYVGNDSGLAHIAAAVRTPSVILYGPTPVEKNLPYQSSFAWPIIGNAPACWPCKYQKATAQECGFKCWESVHVERVRETVFYILKKFYNQRRSG